MIVTLIAVIGGVVTFGVTTYTCVGCVNLVNVVHALDDDDRINDQIAHEISNGLPSYDGSTLSGVVGALTIDGYDVVGVIEDTANVTPDPGIWKDRRIPPRDIPAIVQQTTVRRPCVLPKFAAACVVELRAKFGVMPEDNASVMLLQREYLKLCRDHHVRQSDTALHRQLVINSYYRDSNDHYAAYARYNAPKWLKWLRYSTAYKQPRGVVAAI